MRGISILAAAMVAAACTGSASTAQPAGESAAAAQIEQRDYDVRGFDGVSSVGPHRIRVSVGPAFSVHAQGTAKALERTEVVVENGVLKIEPRHDKRWQHEWDDYDAATFDVTLPRLSGATMVGSGEMTVDRVGGEQFSGSVAGSGVLDIADLSVAIANLSVAGSGDLVARGNVRSSKVSVAGSGNLRARELASGDASISVAGSGDVELTVKGEADVSIVGSGDVAVAGAARCTVSRIGSGKVDCADVEHETKLGYR
jgi:hypothetical protein